MWKKKRRKLLSQVKQNWQQAFIHVRNWTNLYPTSGTSKSGDSKIHKLIMTLSKNESVEIHTNPTHTLSEQVHIYFLLQFPHCRWCCQLSGFYPKEISVYNSSSRYDPPYWNFPPVFLKSKRTAIFFLYMLCHTCKVCYKCSF